MTINNMRTDSVWDLLVARIAALEARVTALEAVGQAGIPDALDEEDPDEFWIGGTDGPDD